MIEQEQTRLLDQNIVLIQYINGIVKQISTAQHGEISRVYKALLCN